MLIDHSQQATCRARPPRKLQLGLLSTLCVTSSLAHIRTTGSCSTVALQNSRRPVECAGGAQMHRLLFLCTERHTSWTSSGDDYLSVHLCSTAVHLASPSKMPTEQRRVCSRQGDWHPSAFVSFCKSTTVLVGNLCLWRLQFRNGKQHLVRISLLSSSLLPAKQQVGITSQSNGSTGRDCSPYVSDAGYEVQVANTHKPVSAVDQPALQQRTQASLQSVPSDSSAVHLSCRLVCLSPSGRHAKQHATANLVSCTGSCWH